MSNAELVLKDFLAAAVLAACLALLAACGAGTGADGMSATDWKTAAPT